MNMVSEIGNGRGDALLEGLRAEFGAIVAERILETEAADFLWEARVRERYLGQHLDVGFGVEEGECELSRVALMSLIGGRWHVAACLVDGEGIAVDLLWKKTFDDRKGAETEFERAV